MTHIYGVLLILSPSTLALTLLYLFLWFQDSRVYAWTNGSFTLDKLLKHIAGHGTSTMHLLITSHHLPLCDRIELM
ncbi:hypothetical protein EDB19DRAFT_1778077 [Suillus lakei]|nr:hypothetical protein EDB19DRAFT_1778077 [Suillus lakei]